MKRVSALKKIVAALTAICLLFLLCGCYYFQGYYIKQEPMGTNYNNIHSGELWMTEDMACLNMFAFMGGWYFEGVTSYWGQRLASRGVDDKGGGSLIYEGDLFMDGNTVYCLGANKPEDEVDETLYLYIYNTDNREKKWITLDGLIDYEADFYWSAFYVLQDTLFLEWHSCFFGENDDKDTVVLYAMSLETEELVTIQEGIAWRSLGVLDGKPAYVVKREKGSSCYTYDLYTYDLSTNKSDLIGEIDHEKTAQADWVGFMYIPNGVLIETTDDSTEQDVLLLYNPYQHKFIAEHMPEVNLIQAIPFEKYAFFHNREEDETDETGWRSVVYRIDLSDGTCERLTTFADEYPELFVTSDNFVYVRAESKIYRCDMDGNKEIVAKF